MKLKRKKEKKKERLSSVIILVLTIIVAIGFFYIANLFSSESGIIKENPIIFCVPENAAPENQKCFYTAHDHMELKIIISEKEQDIGFEKGDLQKSHTHADKSKIHWHSTLDVNPVNKEVIDWSPHSLKSALQELGFDNLGTGTTVILNGKVDTEGLNYIWKDLDKIEVRVE